MMLLVVVVSWLNGLLGGGIIVIAHRGVALEGILDYAHFCRYLWASAQFLGVPSLLPTMMPINTMLFII